MSTKHWLVKNTFKKLLSSYARRKDRTLHIGVEPTGVGNEYIIKRYEKTADNESADNSYVYYNEVERLNLPDFLDLVFVTFAKSVSLFLNRRDRLFRWDDWWALHQEKAAITMIINGFKGHPLPPDKFYQDIFYLIEDKVEIRGLGNRLSFDFIDTAFALEMVYVRASLNMHYNHISLLERVASPSFLELIISDVKRLPSEQRGKYLIKQAQRFDELGVIQLSTNWRIGLFSILALEEDWQSLIVHADELLLKQVTGLERIRNDGSALYFNTTYRHDSIVGDLKNHYKSENVESAISPEKMIKMMPLEIFNEWAKKILKANSMIDSSNPDHQEFVVDDSHYPLTESFYGIMEHPEIASLLLPSKESELLFLLHRIMTESGCFDLNEYVKFDINKSVRVISEAFYSNPKAGVTDTYQSPYHYRSKLLRILKEEVNEAIELHPLNSALILLNHEDIEIAMCAEKLLQNYSAQECGKHVLTREMAETWMVFYDKTAIDVLRLPNISDTDKGYYLSQVAS